jgi:hypothetical protein
MLLRFVEPWWWRQYAPLKRRPTSTWHPRRLNFIVPAMRIWNLTGLDWIEMVLDRFRCRLVADTIMELLLTPWRYISCRTPAASQILCEVSWQRIFTGWDRQPHAQPPTWRTRVSLSLASPSKPVRHEWLYQQLCCSRHSSRVRWCTQAVSPSSQACSCSQ